ncbi:MAG: thioesterase family protein [Verrucomicrobiae bacterium]|nr:thioesterase family protein [Verrucomicrobiae bacterium]
MKEQPRVGLTGSLEFTAGGADLITFDKGKMPPVLSTPSLISYLEQTARLTLQPLLDESESSVGVELEIRHLAPTPPGQKVKCSAKVIFVDGVFVNFQIEAWDESEQIALGTHKRAIINIERFKRRLEKKIKKNQ